MDKTRDVEFVKKTIRDKYADSARYLKDMTELYSFYIGKAMECCDMDEPLNSLPSAHTEMIDYRFRQLKHDLSKLKESQVYQLDQLSQILDEVASYMKALQTRV